jgi:thymidylate synthase ThyX
MSHRTQATVIADSITPCGLATRLTSVYVIFPYFILAERNRHRAFSLSDRSSRAVPPEKLIEEVRNDPAMPAKFRQRTKGMGGGEELTGTYLHKAMNMWKDGAEASVRTAEYLLSYNLAKEIVNRPLTPYMRVHSLMTAPRDGWFNFFGLRLDPAADPTIQVLAQRCYEALRGSTPRRLHPADNNEYRWHLPFVDREDIQFIHQAIAMKAQPYRDLGPTECARQLSAARCAHLSYNDLETGERMTVERALLIYNKLVGSTPIHASPLEHQATPNSWLTGTAAGRLVAVHADQIGNLQFGIWEYPHQQGNLYGWRQARKMLPGEAVAPLPTSHSL